MEEEVLEKYEFEEGNMGGYKEQVEQLTWQVVKRE